MLYDSVYNKGISNILILDDETFILDIFSDFFAKVGANVQTVRTIQHAYQFLDAEVFDLILTDVVLGEDSFSSFLTNIRQSEKYSNTPIIAITGAPEKISESDRISLNGILEKPFTPEELLDGILTHIN